jgi:hypothetical protein
MKTAKISQHFVAVFLILLALLAGSPLRAAEKSDWSSLKQLAAGQTVRVTLNDGASSQGDFQSVSQDTLLLRVSGSDRSIPRENVRRVSLQTSTHGHRGKHALIGAAIGAGGGLGAGAAIDNDCSSTAIVCTGNKGKAILTPLLALVGAGIGALLPAGGWREIYRAR